MAQQTVAERYGTTRRRRVDKIIGGAVAGLMVLGGILFLVFGGLPTSETAIEFRDIAHSIAEDNNSHVTITYEVTAAPGSEVTCVLTALNPSFATVGYKVVSLEASDDRTRRFTEELRTTNLATSVTVKDCWIE